MSSTGPERRKRTGILLVSMILVATLPAAGCGGIVLVVGGTTAGVVGAAQGSSGGGGGKGCGPDIDATYEGMGPNGGTLLSIAIAADPSDLSKARIFAGTRGAGVFYAEADLADPAGWSQWSPSTGDLTDVSVLSLAAPRVGWDVVLAGTDDGLYRSEDGGATWEEVSLPGSEDEVRHLTFSPWDIDQAFGGTRDGILISHDGGESWIEEQSGIEVTGFAVLTDPSPILFVGTAASGVWRRESTTSWSLTDSQPSDTRILSIASSGAIPTGGCSVPAGELYAITDSQVWLSTDEGVSWTLWPAELGNNVVRLLAVTCHHHIAVTQHPASPDRWLFHSGDGGQTWADISPAGRVRSLAVPHEDLASVFAGTEGEGLFWSSDEGDTWEAMNSDLSAQKVLSLAVDPSDPHHAYAGTEAGGLFETKDGGVTWLETAFRSSGYPYPIQVRSMAMDPNFPETLYAGTAGRGLFEVKDGVPIPINSSGTAGGWLTVNAITINPGNQDLYAGCEEGIYVRRGGTSELVRWNQSLSDTRVTAIAVDGSTDTAFLGTRGGELYRSTNRGVTWQKIEGIWPGARITSLAVTRETTPVLFVAVEGAGVYRCPASGGPWRDVFTCLDDYDVQALASSTQVPGRIYAATLHGLFRLDSSTEKWKAIEGAEGENPAFSVALTPWGTFAVYAGFHRGARRVTIAE